MHDAYKSDDELCKWLVENSSGNYRPAAYAAERIKSLLSLKNFANEIINHTITGGNLDGDDIQEIAVKHGLLMPITVNSKCGDNCYCSEVAEFPLTCYRKSLELL